MSLFKNQHPAQAKLAAQPWESCYAATQKSYPTPAACTTQLLLAFACWWSTGNKAFLESGSRQYVVDLPCLFLPCGLCRAGPEMFCGNPTTTWNMVATIKRSGRSRSTNKHTTNVTVARAHRKCEEMLAPCEPGLLDCCRQACFLTVALISILLC